MVNRFCILHIINNIYSGRNTLMRLSTNLQASLYDAQKLTEKIEGLLIESGGELTPELEDLISFKDYHVKDLMANTDIVATSIERIDHAIEFYKQQIESIKSVVNGLSKAQDALLSNVSLEMEKHSINELCGEFKTFKFKANHPKVELPDDLSLIPSEFIKITVSETADKKLISEALKLGKEIAGCRLVQGKSLKITNTKRLEVKDV